MTRLKICGLMDESEVEMVIKAGADAAGFVVEVPGSRHSITAEMAKTLIRAVPVFTKTVAVISPRDAEHAVCLAKETNADILQIHSSLAPIEIAKLRESVRQKIVAATRPILDQAISLSNAADAVLLDTYKHGMLGGTGEVHDWKESGRIAQRLRCPVILAGGLNPGNVGSAIKEVSPYAVDVSSGVERDGRKDWELVAKFARAVWSCSQ
jgi:phosphoribosylanthranilate isomerase